MNLPIASKEIRHEPIKRLHNKKDSKEISVANNINPYSNKEAFFKKQSEGTNIKQINLPNLESIQNCYNNFNDPDTSKMLIDTNCNNLKFFHTPNKTNKNNGNSKNAQNILMMSVTDTRNASDKIQANPSDITELEKEIEEKKSRKDKLNELLITNYGPEIYEFSMELEKQNFFPNSLKKHKIEPEIRTKMIDWMIEVLSAYNSDPQTFSLAVQIMDLYIAKSQNILTNNDIHLVGIVSMYIASKMEDIIPLRMNHVRSKISHNKFSEKDIKKKEKMILETIDFETITTSTYDFIRTFIFDFIHNNRLQIHKLNMFHHIDVFDNVAIFLSKLIYHNEEFSNYK